MYELVVHVFVGENERAGNQNGGGIETGGLLSRKGIISSKTKKTVSYMRELTDTDREKKVRTHVRRIVHAFGALSERGGPSGR